MFVFKTRGSNECTVNKEGLLLRKADVRKPAVTGVGGFMQVGSLKEKRTRRGRQTKLSRETVMVQDHFLFGSLKL